MKSFRMLLLVLLSLWVLPAQAGYEVEPNNSTSTATAIRFGAPVYGNIATLSDVDMFTFDVGSTSSVRVLYMRAPRSFQYNLARIRVTDGTKELASVDAYAADVFTSFDVGVNPEGTYFIEVTGCQEVGQYQDCPEHRSEQYELIVIGLPTPTFESEPNNSIAQADPIGSNAWIFAQHSSKTDADYFRFDVPGPGDVLVHLTRPVDNYVYTLSRIEILDANGNLLTGDDVFAPNGQGRAVVGVTSPSTLYIRVTSCAGGSRCDIVFSNPYQFVLSFRPATSCEIFQDGFDCPARAQITDPILGVSASE